MDKVDKLAREMAEKRGWSWFALGDSGYLGRDWFREEARKLLNVA